MTADEFLKEEQTRQSSKLLPFIDDILKLRQAGLSYNRISIFLAKNGIEITGSGLSDYLRRNGLIGPSRKGVKATLKKTPKESTTTPDPVPAARPVPPGGKTTSDPTFFEVKQGKEVKLDFLDED